MRASSWSAGRLESNEAGIEIVARKTPKAVGPIEWLEATNLGQRIRSLHDNRWSEECNAASMIGEQRRRMSVTPTSAATNRNEQKADPQTQRRATRRPLPEL